MSLSLCWEYRRAEGGASAYWARQPDDFERAVGGRDAAWPREAPQVPADLARTADLLCRLEGEERPVMLVTPTGEIYRLRGRARSEEAGIIGAVVQVSVADTDPRVLPYPDAETEPGELAALLMWCAEGGAAVSISPEAWRGLVAPHPFAQRVYSRLGARSALYDCPPDLADRLTGGGGMMASAANRHRVALLTIDWHRELCERDWHVYAWMEGSNAAWRSVRAAFPAMPYIGRLSDGQFAADDSEIVMAVIGELHASCHDVPLELLASLAQRLDALGLTHHLREAVPQEVAPADAGPSSYGIQATEVGLQWRHPPVEVIAGPDLAALALGPHRDVVPVALVAACKHALETEPADAAEGLFWWQLGVELDLPKLFTDVRLGDALRWAEAQQPSSQEQGFRWVMGLLVLGERTTQAQGPLMSVLATRLARVIRRSGVASAMPLRRSSLSGRDSGAFSSVAEPPGPAVDSPIIRCLRLAAQRDRKQLLVELGLVLKPLSPAPFRVRTDRLPNDDVRVSSTLTLQGAEANRG